MQFTVLFSHPDVEGVSFFMGETFFLRAVAAYGKVIAIHLTVHAHLEAVLNSSPAVAAKLFLLLNHVIFRLKLL